MHMDLFNHLMSAFIGALIAILPAGDPGAQAQARTELSASTTPVVQSVSGLAALRAQLVDLRTSFTREGRAKEEDGQGEDRSEHDASRSASSTDDRGGEQEAHRSEASASISAETHRSRGEHEEDEDEHEDDDHHRGGRAAAQPAATVPAAPASGAGPSVQPAAASFTAAQVATHASVSSCYSIVNGAVYDLTAWIGQHPGGQSAIKRMCGMDASAAFNGQHGGAARPASELAGFKIGTLAN